MYIDRNLICFCRRAEKVRDFLCISPSGPDAEGRWELGPVGPGGQGPRGPEGQRGNRAREMDPGWSTGHDLGADGRRDVRDRRHTRPNAKPPGVCPQSRHTDMGRRISPRHRHGHRDRVFVSIRCHQEDVRIWSPVWVPPSVWVPRFLHRSVPLDAGSSTCPIRTQHPTCAIPLHMTTIRKEHLGHTTLDRRSP